MSFIFFIYVQINFIALNAIVGYKEKVHKQKSNFSKQFDINYSELLLVIYLLVEVAMLMKNSPIRLDVDDALKTLKSQISILIKIINTNICDFQIVIN